MLERTRKKIRQAEFFLDLLTAEQAHLTRAVAESSDFYLSAFLSAAHAITISLSEERPVEYDQWLPKWYLDLTENDRKLINVCGNQHVDTDGELDIEPTDTHVSLGQFLQAFDTQETLIFIETQKMKFSGRGKVTVAAVCREYLDLLKGLVAEFEQVNLVDGADDGPPPAFSRTAGAIIVTAK